MSDLALQADVDRRLAHVRFVPSAKFQFLIFALIKERPPRGGLFEIRSGVLIRRLPAMLLHLESTDIADQREYPVPRKRFEVLGGAKF